MDISQTCPSSSFTQREVPRWWVALPIGPRATWIGTWWASLCWVRCWAVSVVAKWQHFCRSGLCGWSLPRGLRGGFFWWGFWVFVFIPHFFYIFFHFFNLLDILAAWFTWCLQVWDGKRKEESCNPQRIEQTFSICRALVGRIFLSIFWRICG